MKHITIIENVITIKVYSKEGKMLATPINANGNIIEAINNKYLPIQYGCDKGLYFLTVNEIEYIKANIK